MKCLTYILVIAAVLNAGTSVYAARKQADAPTAATTAEAKVPTAEEDGPYELKRRSSVSMRDDVRSPFWPVGWTKADRTVPGKVEKPVFELRAEYFRLTSILTGKRSLAMINGKSFEEGERMVVVAPEGRFNVLVRRVGDGRVVLGLDKQEVIVPLQRQEVASKKETAPASVGNLKEIRIGEQPKKP
jgi:hypothetical protein